MKIVEQNRIKLKIQSINPQKWWGDDFDARFYLISRLKNLREKSILDIGGGIGIISSEIDKSNFRINLDFHLDDLITCRNKTDPIVENVLATMKNLPFNDNSFDVVICSSVLQYAKLDDIEKNLVITKNKINEYPSVEKILSEIARVLDKKGMLFLATPNNAYYNTYMLNYLELKGALEDHFSNYSLWFYNTFPRLNKKHRKLNLANVMPKIISKIINSDKLLTKLLLKEDDGNEKKSVSFYVEAFKY